MLELADLYKRFGPTIAVAGVSFSVGQSGRGEVFGLLGPNGAGKSTTISMISGALAPDSGTARLNGEDPAQPRTRASIGIAPQALALYDELSARENLEFFGSMYGLPRAARRRRADELLALVGLTDRASSLVKTYSGGMKRRLNLAVALIHDPALLLLDEPTAGVDPQSRTAIFDIVTQLREQHRIIIYTTHYMEEAQRLCDRVAVMDHGKILALGTVDNLLTAHGGASTVRIERPQGEERHNTGDPVSILTAEIARGDVLSVHIERPSLESVFLNLTGRSLRD